MKKRLLYIVFFLIFGVVSCGSKMINLEKIKQIESSGNPKAFNKYTKARGLYQITPICLKDYNQQNKKSHKEEDLFIPEINTIIAEWYFNTRIPQLLKAFKKPINDTNILVAYNAGIKKVGSFVLPKETKNYIKKYKGE